MNDTPTLYILDQDSPTTRSDAFRPATPEEIGKVARQYEETLRELLIETCTPIPVRVTWAGRNRIDTELHSRNNCEHVWERGEPRVHLDVTRHVYLLGSGTLERGELDA